jgi:hypothetical protein
MPESGLTVAHLTVLDWVNREFIETANLSDQSWEEILQAATSLQLCGQLLAPLAISAQIPVPIRDQLRLRALQQGAFSAHLAHCLDEILSQTVAQSIPVVLLKGAHAIQDLYSSPMQRLMADLDILIKPNDLNRLGAVLENLGFRPDRVDFAEQALNSHHWVFTRGEVTLEVHWRFAGGVGVSIDDIWTRVVPLDQAQVFGLGLEDRLLYMCHHIAQHKMLARPYHYTDIARFWGRYRDRLNYRRWKERAQEWGRIHRVRLILQVVQTLYPQLQIWELGMALPGSPIPQDITLTALSYLVRSQVESAKVLTMASRSRRPKLWLSSYDLRQKYRLSEGSKPSPLLHFYDWFQRMRGWGRDFLSQKIHSGLQQEVQSQRRLNAWLDSGLQQSSDPT